MKPTLAGLERTAAAERIGLVRHAPAIDGLAMHAIALVVVHLRDRRVDGDLVEVRPAEPRDLRIHIRVDAAREQRIVGEIEPGHDVRGAERHLLGLGEEVVGIAIEHHAADGPHRHQLLGHDLGGIEHVEAELVGLLFGEYLQAQLPLRIGARLDGFPQVAAMKVRIGARDLHGLIPVERMRARTGFQWNFTNTLSPRSLTMRKVCTPKPCIMR